MNLARHRRRAHGPARGDLPQRTVLSQGRRWMLVQLSPQFSIMDWADVSWPSGDRARLYVPGLPAALLVAFDRPRADAEDASGLRLRRPLVYGAKQMGPEVVGICAHDNTSMLSAYSSTIHLQYALIPDE
jgi:hypothetical protein